MIRFTLRRLLEGVPLLLLLSGATFGLFKMIPGDFLTEMALNPSISREHIERLRESYGLDRPAYVQYFQWLGQVARGNLGYSFAQRRPAGALIRERLANTALLTGGALLAALALAIPIGVWSALRAGRWPDLLSLAGALMALSLPSVVTSLLLLYFAYRTGWLPLGGVVGFSQAVLPSLVLALPTAAILSRTLRTELLETFRRPFMTALAAKGVSRSRFLYHALRNSINPIISLIGLALGGFLSGAVVVESVFDWPGIGALTVHSILGRDLFVAVNCVLVAALAFLAANFLTDILLALNDPRVRHR